VRGGGSRGLVALGLVRRIGGDGVRDSKYACQASYAMVSFSRPLSLSLALAPAVSVRLNVPSSFGSCGLGMKVHV